MRIFGYLVVIVKHWLRTRLVACTHTKEEIVLCVDDAPDIVYQCFSCERWVIDNKLATFTPSKLKPKYHSLTNGVTDQQEVGG